MRKFGLAVLALSALILTACIETPSTQAVSPLAPMVTPVIARMPTKPQPFCKRADLLPGFCADLSVLSIVSETERRGFHLGNFWQAKFETPNQGIYGINLILTLREPVPNRDIADYVHNDIMKAHIKRYAGDASIPEGDNILFDGGATRAYKLAIAGHARMLVVGYSLVGDGEDKMWLFLLIVNNGPYFDLQGMALKILQTASLKVETASAPINPAGTPTRTLR